MGKILIALTLSLSVILATGLAVTEAQVSEAHQLADYPELYGPEAKPTIVVIKMENCVPCKIHWTTVVALRDRHYRVRVYDAKEHPKVAEFFGVTKVPYTALLKDGVRQNEWVGVINWRYIARSAGLEYKLE